MPPILLFICGRPGTGKTTLAKAFARKNKFLYLDKDDIAEPLCPNDRESARYKTLHFPIYEALLEVAHSNIKLGQNVLIDSPFNQLMQDPEWWGGVENKFREAKIKVVRTFCEEDENLNRIKTRGLTRDNDKITDFAGSLKIAPMLFKIIAPHLDLSTEVSLEAQIKAVEAYLI